MLRKPILIIVGILLLVIAGLGLYIKGLKTTILESKPKVEVTQTVILEQIKKVLKLTTIEGHFSEIYTHKEYYGFDWSMLTKKALIRVNAKVSIGYDFETLNVVVDEVNKKVRISQIPKAEILSIDHDLDYFDIQQGVFNSFTKDDYNKINASVKSYIRKVAEESELFDQAHEQLKSFTDLLSFILAPAGYELVIEVAPETPLVQ